MKNRIETDPEMFETGKSIREAKLRQIRDEGRQEGIELLRRRLEESGVSVPQDVVERLHEERSGYTDGCDEPPRNGFLRLIKRRSRC